MVARCSSAAMVAAAVAVVAVMMMAGGARAQPSSLTVACPVLSTPITPQVQFDLTDATKGLQVRTSSCPNYNYTLQSTGNLVGKSCRSANYPYPPKLNAYASRVFTGVYKDLLMQTKNTEMIGGPVGHSVNGIALYSNSDMLNRVAYMTEGKTFDQCSGHASGDGLYHYHSEPPAGCVYTDVNTTHSPLFAIMADGFPLYGRLGDGGVVPTDLDDCNGHQDASHPFYHYHLPAEPNTYPYTVNCFRGCLPSNAKGYVACVEDTATYGTDFTVLKSELAAASAATYECTGDGTSGGGGGGMPSAAAARGGSHVLAAAAALALAALLRA